MNARIVAPVTHVYCTSRGRRAAACVFFAGALLTAPLFAWARQEPNDPPGPPASAPTVSNPAPTVAPADAALPASVAPAFHDTASGVEIYTAMDQEMFPASWHDPAIAATAKPLAVGQEDRAVRLMLVALSKYPPSLLRLNLRRIYMVSDLEFQGISASGTNSANRLYIVIDADDPLYTDAFIEESFHHEFAHMLRRNYPLSWFDATWNKDNPTDFHYGAGNGVEAVKDGHASLVPTDDWNEKGFLSQYASEDIGEDFATIAGGLFTGDPSFWQRADRFPALKTKAETAIGFYIHLAASFTETYFRSLRAGIAFTAPPPPSTNTAVVVSAGALATPSGTATSAQPQPGTDNPPASRP